MTLYCSPRARTGKGRGREGAGLYPELAAYRISEGSSPNVQAEVGRQVALLPIEQARAELARRGLESDEKAVRRIANELGAQMLATRTRDLLRFRRGELPAGEEFEGEAGRRGDRWRPGAGADGDQEGPRRRQDQARALQGGVARAQAADRLRDRREGPDGQGVSADHRRHVARPRCLDRVAGLPPASPGRGGGQGGDLHGGSGAVDLGATGLGDRPGRAGAGAGGGGPGLVPRGASPEPGLAGVGVVRGGADRAVCATAPVAQEGPESRR